MIAARDRTLVLMKELGAAAREALKSFERDPRWCGLPGPDVGKFREKYDLQYPYDARLSRYVPSAGRNPTPQRSGYDRWDGLVPVVDEKSGHLFHQNQIVAFARYFEAGTPAYKYEYGVPKEDMKVIADESPITFMDRVRRNLRYMERTDDRNLLTTTFALLECKPVGRPYPDIGHEYDDVNLVYKEIRLGTFSRKYEYTPIRQSVVDVLESVRVVQTAMKRVFDHVSVSLLPEKATEAEIAFLGWIHKRGGEARSFEVNEFLEKSHLSNNGQDPAFSFFKKFCEKTGNSGTRKPWRVRPEALRLIGVDPDKKEAA